MACVYDNKMFLLIGGTTWGINGETGQLADMKELGIWEPLTVKLQVYKTAIEVSILFHIFKCCLTRDVLIQ